MKLDTTLPNLHPFIYRKYERVVRIFPVGTSISTSFLCYLLRIFIDFQEIYYNFLWVSSTLDYFELVILHTLDLIFEDF